MIKANTGTMVLSNTVRACSLSDMEGAVFDILSNETIQQACKKGPLFITKGNNGYDLYLGYDKEELFPTFFFFSWSETQQTPSSERFVLSVHIHPFGQYVDQLKEEFGIISPEILQELVDAAMSPYMMDIKKTSQEAIQAEIQGTSIYQWLRALLLNPHLEIARKDALLIKKGAEYANLYLGEVIDSTGKKSLSFFSSPEGYKDSKNDHPCSVSLNNFLFVENLFTEKFDIHTIEELESLVSAAIAPQMTEKIQETGSSLNKVIQ